MRSAFVLALVLVTTASTHADPAVSLTWEPPESGILELDPLLRTHVEGIDATETVVDRSLYRLGPHTRASTTSTILSSGRDAHLDGWSVAARLSRDVGWGLTLTLDASLTSVLGGLDREHATYGSLRIALSRLIHWSHKRVAWISLGLEYSGPIGTDAGGLPGGTVVGVNVGTTF